MADQMCDAGGGREVTRHFKKRPMKDEQLWGVLLLPLRQLIIPCFYSRPPLRGSRASVGLAATDVSHPGRTLASLGRSTLPSLGADCPLELL